ncbi:MAG: MG2 domain-containing protein [Victivallaceae bacterium]|nr:MG2 domain-containing protein [Victivallaceae bacterium]
MKKLVVLLSLALILGSVAAAENRQTLEDRANAEFENNNCKDAFYLYKKILLNYRGTPELYLKATASLQKAELEAEFDGFFAAVAAKYGREPAMAVALAQSKMQLPDYGYIIAGQFVRGSHRGGGEQVWSSERDRVEALRLLTGVLEHLPKDGVQAGKFYRVLSEVISWERQYDRAWKLQYWTDLNQLPDYEHRAHYYLMNRIHGAPVGTDGKPLFYHAPETFGSARNDGERWRWSMEQILQDKNAGGELKARTGLAIAAFFKSQFGVETIGFNLRDKIQSLREGPYALQLLHDNESIANLATGVQKIKLPDDCNYIAMYKQLDAEELVRIYENRRQYAQAAAVLRELVKTAAPKEKERYNRRLAEITGNWVELPDCGTFPAGRKPAVSLTFRNTRAISCTLTGVKIAAFLAGIRKYLEHEPTRREMNRLGYQPEQVGSWLLEKQGERYQGGKIAEWRETLQPLPGHFDKTVQLRLPVEKAGVYFLTVTADRGNTSRIIVWLADLAVIERDANGGKLYLVTDALTGKPVDYCRLKFSGYKSSYIRDKNRRSPSGDKYVFTFSDFFTQTNANGTIFVDAAKLNKCGRVMVQAEADGRFGVLGFSGLYCRQYRPQTMKVQHKIYAITDRPVYKPGQTVKFNYWLRTVGHGLKDYGSRFAGTKVKLVIRSPRRTMLEKELAVDNSGAFNSAFKLPDDADLGVYSMSLDKIGGGVNFRVEEYRKPEYEVKVTVPDKPLLLGDDIPVTIRAEYLFGYPVANAEVKYRVYRTPKPDCYLPFDQWNWLYGRNAGGFEANYRYVSWQSRVPTELVADNSGTTDAEGELTFTVNTALAKALFGDEDSEYRIVAEVADRSRYTETGQGTVIAACTPFRVFCTVRRGFYRIGEVIELTVSAPTAARAETAGKYRLTLSKINYDANNAPVRTKLKTWSGEKPAASVPIRFRLGQGGHYLAEAAVTDAAGRAVSGAAIIRVNGPGTGGTGKLTALPLGLAADKKTYRPGDTASLLISTAAPDQSVYLFVRPASTAQLNFPELLHVSGGAMRKEFYIRRADMPNIFIEALAVRDGRVYDVTKQLLIPPEKKLLQLELKTAAGKYQPGQQCPLQIRLTDAAGRPVSGDVVVTVYDKALDILSGGSNIPEINSFFWKWTRYWYVQLRSSLDKHFRQVLKKDEPAMSRLGIFGYLPAPGEVFGAPRGGLRQTKNMTADTAEPAESAAAETEGGEVTVRKDFADSALWRATLKTDRNGIAELPIPLPDNLTAWKIRAWAMTGQCCVGQGESEVIVSKDYLVRLILPRFLISGDTAVFSAIVMNRGKTGGEAAAALTVSGDSLQLPDASEHRFRLAAPGEQRLDWQVKAVRAGKATVRVKSVCGKTADAMELQLPVEVKGITRQTASSGCIQPEQTGAAVNIAIPRQRREKTTDLTVNFSPSIAAAMVEALPYLIDTDDKDVFSTLNRFIPALAVFNTLKKLGLTLAETGGKTADAGPWKRLKCNPVFDDEQLNRLVSRELTTLAGMQNRDGGWGWFSGFGESSSVYPTVRTVRAAQRAAADGAAVDKTMLSRGVAWLEAWQQRRSKDLKEADNTDALVFDTLVSAGIKSGLMLEKLFTDRSKLSPNGLVLLAAACHTLKDEAKLAMLLKNIDQFAAEDAENQTAYLRLPENRRWWCWYGRDIDTQAAYLKLLAKTDPRGHRAAGLAKYILINRKHATYWTSAVDTGLCVEALCDFLLTSGEANPEMTVEVRFDGKVVKKTAIDHSNLFSGDNTVKLAGADLTTGDHKLEIRREGKGAVYFNTYLSYFTLADSIKSAGLDLKIKRRYFKLIPVKAEAAARGGRGQALEEDTEKYNRMEILDPGKVSSGDVLEIEFTVEAKNDYEYIVITDGKPAGFEPVSILSGYTGKAPGAFAEMRDTTVRFYLRCLARGTHSLAYRMRAVTPGKFTALPAVATGVYAPELRCNSDEFRIEIKKKRIYAGKYGNSFTTSSDHSR